MQTNVVPLNLVKDLVIVCNPWILWGALILFRIVDYYNLQQMHTFILFYFFFAAGYFREDPVTWEENETT